MHILAVYYTTGDEGECLESIDVEIVNKDVTHGVPLMLSTVSWVSSRLMYPNVRPANTPEERTRMGMRTAKAIDLESCGSNSLARFAKGSAAGSLGLERKRRET